MNYYFYIGLLALKSVWRRRRRNLFVTLVTACAVASLVVFYSFIDKIFWGVRESTIHSQTGHLQITHPDFATRRNADALSVLLNNTGPLIEELEAIPHVQLVTTRLEFSGLVGMESASTVFIGQGVDPQREALLSSFEQIVAGHEMTQDEGSAVGVSVGEGLARSLNVAPGNGLLLMARSAHTGLNAIDVQVSAVTRSDSSDYDRMILKMPMAHAQSLLGTQGVSRIIVLLDDTDRTQDVQHAIDQILARKGLHYRIDDWNTLNPGYTKIVGLYSRIFGLFSVMLLAVVVLSLSNTLLMGFMERIRDLSVMRAIGAGPGFLSHLFVFESVIVGLIGGVLGCVLAWAVIAVITRGFDGIGMPPPPGSDQPFRLRPVADIGVMGLSLLGASLTALAASIAPVVRVIRLRISAGMRIR